MNNRNNLPLRLNLLKRAVITYKVGPDAIVNIDISSDGKIRVNDNGMLKDYVVEQQFAYGFLHEALAGIFFEEMEEIDHTDTRNVAEWNVVFYNRRHLDHIAYGTKRTSIQIQRELRNAIFYLEWQLGIDLRSKYLDSLYEIRKEEQGNPAVVSEQIFDDHYDHIKTGMATLTKDFQRTVSQVRTANAVYVDNLYKDRLQKSFVQKLLQ